jgi:hypothetical protein
MSKFDRTQFGRAFVAYATILTVACLGAAWIREENKPIDEPSTVVATPLSD